MRSYPAIYNGYRFSSRLESRWACWWDLCGVVWRYEPEVVPVEEDLTYIPDFFLPDWQAWVEIKGEIVDEATGLKIVRKCEGLAAVSGLPVILCFHDPFDPTCAIFYRGRRFAACQWSMCRHCGEVAIRGGSTVRCPVATRHTEPIDLATQRLRSRLIYDAAVQVRRRKFAWPRKNTHAGTTQGSH